MKACFVPKRFNAVASLMIERCNRIIEDYQAAGYRLTLRQVYYQLVARDLFPDEMRWRWTGAKYVRDENGTKNADPNYKWLGDLLNDGRLAGLVDWEAIEDRGRYLRTNAHWNSPSDIMDACARSFAVDMWEHQEYRPEVWVEKDALVGVVEQASLALDVPAFSCRGYASVTSIYEAAVRLQRYHKKGQTPCIIHLGDHDPSGIDMTRDVRDRLAIFGLRLEVNRIALNMDQVEQYGPPPNPAKLSDSRANGYVEQFGYESWELDALEPSVLTDLIRQSIQRLLDPGQWREDKKRQQEGRRRLKDIAKELEDEE